MSKKLIFLLGISFILTSCSSSAPQPNMAGTAGAYTALAEAAASASQSLTQLGETEQAANPPVSVSEPPNPNTYGMAIPTSIDWDGPVEPIVQQIANSANYQLKVLGKAPSIPVIVSISAKDTPLGDILRDVGYQSGNQAQVVVFPSTHVIELRYANQ